MCLTSKFWKVFHEILGISKTVHTARYTPNNNDKVDRVNQVLGNTLRSLCNDVGTDWSENLTLAEFGMNTEKHITIDMSTFNLVYLREPLWSDNTLDQPTLDAREDDRCFSIFTRACDCLEDSKLCTERILTSQRRTTPPLVFRKGTHVKLLPKFVGPFEVLKPPVV